MKVALIPWSGGLDSTYSVLTYLENGFRVDAPYFTIENNKRKVKFELETIKRFKEMEPFKTHIKNRMLNVYESSSVHIKAERDCIASLTQPPIWMMTAFFCLGDRKPVDELVISYVLNDCAVSYVDDLKKLWNSLRGFVCDKNLYPKLNFPLLKQHKLTIIDNYINHFKNGHEILDNVWWCENPRHDGSVCGCCTPCKRYKEISYFKDKFK